MGGAEEAGLERGGRQVDAVVEGVVEERLEVGGGAGDRVVVVAYRILVEEDGEHGPGLRDLEGEAFFPGRVEEGVAQGAPGLVKGGEGAGPGQLVQRGDPGGHGQRVAAERAGLVDRPERGEVVHDVGASAEGADREAAADDFAHGGEVGGDAGDFLGAAGGEAEAGHDLIENENAGVGGAGGAEGFKEAGVGQDKPAVGGVGLDDDGGDGVAMGIEGGVDGPGVVVLKDKRLGGKGSGNARAVGVAEGEGPGAGLDEEGVDMAVVTTGKLDDLVAAGEAAGQADGGQGGLGPAVAHADLLHGRDQGHDAFGHVHFQRVGGAEAGSALERLRQRRADAGVVVPVDGRPPGADQVDQLPAVGGVEPGSLRPLGEKRRSADRPERPDR